MDISSKPRGCKRLGVPPFYILGTAFRVPTLIDLEPIGKPICIPKKVDGVRRSKNKPQSTNPHCIVIEGGADGVTGVGLPCHTVARRKDRRLNQFIQIRLGFLRAGVKLDDYGDPLSGACIDADTMARTLRRWVDGLPELLTDAADKHGQPLPFDRNRIFPYAFRHTYAQRHADAGTDLHTLRDLMDHKSADTTMGYFKVSIQRRRAAVEAMRTHVVDRYGQPRPTSSATAYEARSVAVPFGNCTEPSNVKAGGGQCPIRFQCSGCGFYRPDPSFLPAVEDHIRALKADRETARALDVAEFVVRNLTDQIDSFQNVVTSIRTQLAAMPDNERHHLEEAAAVLRKVRAAAPLPLLPVPTFPTRGDPS